MFAKRVVLFSLVCFFTAPALSLEGGGKEITIVTAARENTFSAAVKRTPESWEEGFSSKDLSDTSKALVYRFPRSTVFAFSVAKMGFPVDVIGVDHTGHVTWVLEKREGERLMATPSAVIAIVVVHSAVFENQGLKQGNLVIPRGFGLESRNSMPGLPDGAAKVREALAKVCSKKTKEPQACLDLADFQLGLGELDEADETYRRSLAVKPTARAHEGRARIADSKGEKAQAIAHLKKAVSLEDASLYTYRRLAVSAGTAESSQHVLEILEGAARKRPEMVDLRLILARVLIARREFRKAEQSLEPLMGDEEDRPKALRVVGDVFLRQGKKEKAAQAYKEYLEAYPFAPHAAELRAFILVHGVRKP